MEENNIQKPSVEFITTDLREASKVLEELGNYRHANMCISACCELTYLQQQLQQYKQQIEFKNKVLKEIHILIHCGYILPARRNGKTVFSKVLQKIDDLIDEEQVLSKLKERDEK